MSVTSPDNNTTDTDFSDLLSRHPELAQWLAAHSEQEPALNTEEVHKLFLEECTVNGISNEEYPFAVDDYGKAALLGYYSQLPHRPMELPPSDILSDAPVTVQEDMAGRVTSLPGEETVVTSPTIDDTRDEILPAAPTETKPVRPTAPTTRRLRKKYRIIHLVLLGIIALSILIPIGFAISYGINAYETYTNLRDTAHDGVQHLLNIKTIFTGIKTHPTSAASGR